MAATEPFVTYTSGQCSVCLQPYVYELEYRCSVCDGPLCPFCRITVRDSHYCTDCEEQDDDRPSDVES